jgi:hypothetical protein
MPLLYRILHFRWLLILLIFVVLPFSLYGAKKAWEGNENNVADWMPDDFEATRELARFGALFGSDELLMISWEGCSLDDPRIALFKAQLLRPVDTKGGGRTPLFREVITGPEILDFYQEPPLNVDREGAIRRMTGWICSESGDTCLIALVSDAGMADRHAAVAVARRAASKVPDLPSESVHLAGPTLEGVAIDEISQERLLTLNAGSFLISLLVMITCLRSIRASLLVFSIAVFNEVSSLALIYYCGTQLNSILLLTANLNFVISISIGIHLVNYYRDVLHTHPRSEAAVEAFRRAWTPTALATLTTALGLASLMASEIKPIVAFGGYSAVCVVLSMFVTLFYVTIHFYIWPLPAPRNAAAPKNVSESPASESPVEPARGGLVGRLWVRGEDGIHRARFVLLMGAVAILIWGYLGADQLQTSVGLQDLLAPETQVVRDYHWLEDHIGPLVPIEVTLEFPVGDAKEMMEQFRAVAKLHDEFQALTPSNAVISSATFAPKPPARKGGFRQVARVAGFRRKLLDSQEELKDLGYFHPAEDVNYWRITVRAPATAGTNYGELIASVKETVATTFDKAERRPFDVIVSGGIPLVHQAQQQLLEDLIHSFLLAFVMVCATLMVLFRSLICGLVCMIPNILPSALVFGWMGWRETPVDIGAILTATTALGIAVDDSLHFITWFRRRLTEGGTIREAILFSHRQCALAMIQTTMICTLGLLVLALSDFTPIANFSWCMLVLLSTALVADLIVLPAILLTPLGSPFIPRSVKLSAKHSGRSTIN